MTCFPEHGASWSSFADQLPKFHLVLEHVRMSTLSMELASNGPTADLILEVEK